MASWEIDSVRHQDGFEGFLGRLLRMETCSPIHPLWRIEHDVGHRQIIIGFVEPSARFCGGASRFQIVTHGDT